MTESNGRTGGFGRERRLLCYAGIGMLILIVLARAGQADVAPGHDQPIEQTQQVGHGLVRGHDD